MYHSPPPPAVVEVNCECKCHRTFRHLVFQYHVHSSIILENMCHIKWQIVSLLTSKNKSDQK